MDWIELVNMEYGECVVLGTRRGEILMVDCGSVNQILRDGDVPLSAWYETLGERYAPAQDRYFLLTHYHKDHIAGFFKLLEREEGYFHRVFLPRAPADETGRPLLLEYALFAYLFQPTQSEDYRVNTACVRMFRTLREKLGEDRIFTLGKGDRFSFGEVDYQVLWPRVEGLPLRRGDPPGQRGAERAVRLPLPAGVRQALFTAEGGVSLPVPAVLPELRPRATGPCPSAAGRTWTCWRKPSRGWRPCGRSWEPCPPPTTSGRS